MAEPLTGEFADYDPYEDLDPYDHVDPEYDEACRDVRDAWRELTGEAPLEASLPEDAERAAAELLAADWDVVGDEDGASLVWKIDPLEALARVRPRLVGAARPVRQVVCPARASRPQVRARTPRTRRRRTLATRRGPPREPDEPSDARLAGRVA
jgi:hypothetical protein